MCSRTEWRKPEGKCALSREKRIASRKRGFWHPEWPRSYTRKGEKGEIRKQRRRVASTESVRGKIGFSAARWNELEMEARKRERGQDFARVRKKERRGSSILISKSAPERKKPYSTISSWINEQYNDDVVVIRVEAAINNLI